jgi:hypothetical protein
MWPSARIGGNEVSGVVAPRFRVSSSKGEDTVLTNPTDPNHHLWRNGRLWWVAFTVHLPGWQKERVRLSLGTPDLFEARHLRDRVLASYPQSRPCELSLRFSQKRMSASAAA